MNLSGPFIRRPVATMLLSLAIMLLGGVSFQKGCYPGQEVVARLEGRGGNVSRLVRGLRLAEAPQLDARINYVATRSPVSLSANSEGLAMVADEQMTCGSAP